MKRASFMILAPATLALLAACGGGAPATLAPGATQGPGATSAPGGRTVAPATQGGGPVGNTCSAVPTFNALASPQPELPGDSELEALFPTEINGEPVEGLNSFRWLDYLCYYSGQAAVDGILVNVPGGISPTLTYANAEVSIDGDTVSIDAFRTPGQDAGLMVQNFSQLIFILGGDLEATQGTMAPAAIGGKSAFVWTQSDDEKTYLYVRGDTLFGLNSLSDTQADAVFAALP